MNQTNCVYKITNLLNNKIYIGVAKDFNRRMYQHQRGQDAEKCYIDNAILKYGWTNFKAEIIDNYTTEEERKEKEKYYIQYYHSLREEGGYNLTRGGDETCFYDTSGENNPRAQLTKEDVYKIRQRRMNGERLADVYADYQDKLEGDRRAGFSKVWLHESWPNVGIEFKGKYPKVDPKNYATIRRNQITEEQKERLTIYFQWFGPIKYNTIYCYFKHIIDWQSFQELCKEIVTYLYGTKDNRKYARKTGKLEQQISENRKKLINEPNLNDL